MKSGWYIVYLLMIAINSVMTNLHGFGPDKWQHWVWLGMLVLCYIAGNNSKMETSSVPDQAHVAYLCDQKRCIDCTYPECKHTTDLEHAANFVKIVDGVYEEKED